MMPLLNNYLANSPSFLGGITPGQSTGTVEPQKSSVGHEPPKNEAFGGGGFGPPQGAGGMGGLFTERGINTPWFESFPITGGMPNMFSPHMPTENIEPSVAPPHMSAPSAPLSMMPPPAPPMGVSPMFNAPQYSPPGANSAAVQQATPEIMKFANPQTSPNFTANAMPIYK